MRTIVWFSCGAASAVCAKLLCKEPGIEVVYIQPGTQGETGSEHPDNARFLADVSKWIGLPVTVIRNEKYKSVIDLCLQQGFIKGPRGAICTRILKREVRMNFERPDDVQVFGYTLEEKIRADQFRLNNPNVILKTPLIEQEITKDDCLGLLWQAGIELPVMYKQGYNHNNCIMCVKGGIGYANKIRKDYPEAFNAWAIAERVIGHSILKDEQGPIWLDELDPTRGKMETEPEISCGLTCYGLSQAWT